MHMVMWIMSDRTTDADELLPRNVAALQAAAARGVRVMVVTGRSELATIPVLDELGLDSPAVVFNGAGVWSTAERRLIEERVLSERTLARAFHFGRERGLLTVAMCAGIKYALRPRGEVERLALRDMTGVTFIEPESWPAGPAASGAIGRVIRVTFFSDSHENSADFARAVEQELDQPVYLTHFPLRVLAHHRESALDVVDVHPPCRGKGEALRFVHESFGIRPERMVAVGDATNDLPMFEGAGLAVAMSSGMPEAIAAADRVIGDNNSTALADLVEELFPD
jgi:hydroxymethylpyrimidine pyrophosphatase-like HAD family hydrolase